MTAIEVYGVRVGDFFKNEEDQVLKVVEFITPKTLVEPWRAVMVNAQGEKGEMEVKDLLAMREYLK